MNPKTKTSKMLAIIVITTLLVVIPLLGNSLFTEPSDNSTFDNTISLLPHDDDQTLTSLGLKTLAVNVTLNTTQVVKNSFLGINVSVMHNDNPIGDVDVTIFYSQSALEKNTTEFIELEKGVYFAALNTTDLNFGVWKLKAQVEKSGFETQTTTTQFSVINTIQKRDYPSPAFLMIISVAILIPTVGIISSVVGFRKKETELLIEELLAEEDIKEDEQLAFGE